MAPVVRSIKRKDAINWPRMSTTFWAVLLLTALLIVYCGQLAAGTCEIVTLDRDSSQPRRTIARQTARCACKKGQIAGTTRARPACVDDIRALDEYIKEFLTCSHQTSLGHWTHVECFWGGLD
ncbi:chemokine-like protein TAFA-5 isoform X3 [Carassius carassius]|uniref:chemokine-like protein TAFA-5 isoform X3 n=1 Tax=Carassius carassius TaxID=217509 RepID=UPI00286883EC|nr:chemokine-like protein TAFA-5 isoform X3 [Carassius carassius]